MADFVIVGLLFLVALFIFAVIYTLSIQNNFPRLVKSIKDAEATRLVRFGDYIRAEHPEKLPVTLREHPLSKPPEMADL